MAGLLGKIEQYDPEVEEWPQYVERLEHFFKANGIVGEANADKRRSTFLTVVGPAPYKLLRSLLAPTRPDEKTFEQLAATLASHYSPAPSEVVQRFKFNTRTRSTGESVAAFVAELRRLAEFCNYGDKLNEMLRDRIVCGVNNEAIQRKLLAERDLTYDRAFAIAQGSELADRNMREIRKPQSNSLPIKQEPVHKIQARGQRAKSQHRRSQLRRKTLLGRPPATDVEARTTSKMIADFEDNFVDVAERKDTLRESVGNRRKQPKESRRWQEKPKWTTRIHSML